MPDRGRGFSYFGGPRRIYRGKPASAFSAGNILMLDSSSSLSAMNLTLAPDAYAVAITDSDKSDANGNVPIDLIISPEQRWWAHTGGVASTYTVGSRWDYIASGGNHIVHSSATTVRLVVAAGGAQADIDQSDESRIVVHMVGAGGELVFI